MTTQRKLTVAEYLTFTDLYAKAVNELTVTLGDEDTVGTAAHEAKLVRDLIVAFTNPDEYKITADLIDAAGAVVDNILRLSALSSYFGVFNSAVRQHLGEDLNAWLSAEGSRVHYLYKLAGDAALAPANVFPPVSQFGSYAVTGSGAGTFTAGPGINSSLYGGSRVEAEVTDAPIGAANINVSLTCVMEDGSPATKTGTIPSGSIVGAKIDLGQAGDKVIQVTAVTITLGTAGDKFRLQSKVDRALP